MEKDLFVGKTYRDKYCGEVNKDDVDKKIKLCGWVNSIRNLGSLMFITLRDETGIVQLITEEGDKYKDLTRESTVCIEGIVRLRSKDMINPEMKTGEIEVLLDSLTILGKSANTLPFEINRSREYSEDLRLKYRYLDLRNKEVHDNIVFRSNVISFIRKEMQDMGFTEIQTPIVTATSPEGARDFIIPARKYPGKFYALPQAPQIFKQLLMVSGFNKYFQIAPCFRDEDARADRLYGEFYQLDFEMSFVNDEDVYMVGEKVFYDIFTNFSNKEVSKPPFTRIPYKEAILKYGTDKPDLRNPLIIEDVTDILSKSSFEPFKNTCIRAIKASVNKPNSWYKEMEEYTKSIGGILGYIKITEEGFKSSLDKFFDDEIRDELKKCFNLQVNDTLFIVASEKAPKIMGQLRIKLGEELELTDKNKYAFCIVNDFPFFERDDDGNLAFCHNPFSMMQGGMKALEEQNPDDILAYQYDFVCNGYEMASGGVRNHDPEILKKAFALVGYDESVVKSKFPSLYEAFKYGAPPHAGMAPGIDRIIMLLKDEENIREIVPFAMSANGMDEMMGAPSEVFDKQLKEAHIKIDIKE